MIENQDSIIEFPCDFPIKVIGKSSTRLSGLVLSIIRRHISDFLAESMCSKKSGKGKYTSVTITVRVSSKNILDAIYNDLSSDPEIIIVL